MAKSNKKNRNQRRLGIQRRKLRRLFLESLEGRQLMAVNVFDDVVAVSTPTTINVITNDNAGDVTQTVSAVNFDYDPATVDKSTNVGVWFIPDRPGTDPAVPQRSVIANSLVEEPGFSNFGDLDLFVDAGGTVTDRTDDIALTRPFGMVIPTVRENIVPSSGSSSRNLAVLAFNNDNANEATNAWISMGAAPQNDGEIMARVAASLFPFENGWRGAAFNNDTLIYAPEGTGISSLQDGTGRYIISVEGVTDSNTEGYLFTVAGGNSDNYTQSMPLGGNQWLVARRDNSAAFTAGENGTYSVLYVPRGTQGVIAAHVDGDSTGVNPLYQQSGNVVIQRESDGLWRLTIPGYSATTGGLLLESNDASLGTPGNVYLSYEADGDDFLIRQLIGNTMAPSNADFQFLFVPFENQLTPTTSLTVTALTDTGSPANENVSDLGIALSINSDGTVNYQLGDQVRALNAGETATDKFVYIASDGVDAASATVTLTWTGANDAPEIVTPPSDQIFNEDDAPVVIDLTTVFTDVDNGDTLAYSFDPGLGGLVEMSLDGTNLSVGPAANAFGLTQVSVTATDSAGASTTAVFSVTIFPQNDDVVAVDDSALTDKVTQVAIPVIGNDYHPDTTIYSVAAAEVFVDSTANTNETSIWSIVGTTAGPNELTVQSAPNVGDVAIGRNGLDLSPADGVLVGTVMDGVTPYSTANTYRAFGSYGFGTEVGAGGNGERNAPLGTAFFPFGEAWTSGHVASDGTLLGGVGVAQADIVKLGTGLWEIAIPEVSVAANDGFLFVSGANADDNIVTVSPSSSDNKWQVRQLDNDAAVDGFEDDPWSFVYIPGTTTGLIGARYGGFEEDRGVKQQFGALSVAEDANGQLTVTVDGYTPADGVLLAQTSGSESTLVDGIPITIPKNDAVVATAVGNDFFVQSLDSGTWTNTIADVQFVFLPYATPLERYDGLEFSITSFDATSTLGAAITQNADGTLNYDPTGAGAPISDLGNGESINDTFTYTVTDGRGGTSTATVTITVQGENQVPTANDDTINLSEIHAKNARLTVLVNDTDPDLATILGTPQGTVAANLAVDASSVWSVAGTGTGPNSITLGAGTTGDVEILRDGAAIAQADGVVIATVRENYAGDAVASRLVQAYANTNGGTSLALQQFGGDGAADAPVAVSYFPFADNWIGGHVDGAGTLAVGNGVANTDIVKTGTGRYTVTIPGITDASIDGFLFAIGNENADNVVSTRAIAGSGAYEVAVRDNQQDFGAGEDGGFSFVFIPRNSENLIAGVVDTSSPAASALSLSIGEFSLERLDVADQGYEWKLTIPGQSPDSGVLILANQDNIELEDNHLTYASDGAGSFLIRSYDMPGLALQGQPFTFAFVPFENPGRPVFRPVPDLLSVTAVDATSAQGATLTLNADGTISYDPGTRFDALYTGDTAVDTFSYTMDDGFGGSDTATVTINVVGYGDVPTLVTSAGATYYGLGDSAVGVDPQVSLVEVGAPVLDGAVITAEITSGELATDILVLRNEGDGAGQVGISGTDVTFGGTVIGTFVGGDSGNPLVVTLNAAATSEAVGAVLRAISFGNFDSATGEGTRQVSLSLVDGGGRSSNVATKGIELGILRRRALQKGLDVGYGAYAGASDTTLRQSAPDTIADPTADFLVDWDGGSVNSQVLLKFGDIFGDGPGQIPVGSIITSAELLLDTNPNTANAPGDGATFSRMLQDWDESTATWNSFGEGLQKDDTEARSSFESFIGVPDGSGSTGTGLMSISVLEDVRAWAAGETNYGWAVIGWDGNTDGWFFSTSENTSQARRPQLKIDWLPATTYDAVSFQDGVDGYEGTVDTVVRADQADTDLSATNVLFVDAPTPDTQALIRFENIFGDGPGQIPLGSRIITARLTTTSITNNAMGDGGKFHAILADWSDTDTYNTLVDGMVADDVDALSTYNTAAGNASRNPNVQGGRHGWDVTADLQAWSNGSIANKGWAILPWTAGTDGWGFTSSEWADVGQRPKLEIYYTESTNQAPTDILLDNSSVPENTSTAGGLVIGSLSTVDPDAGDTHTYQLIAGAGDSDLFTINGNTLSINETESLDFETKPAYTVRVRTTDAGGLTFDRDLTIDVIDRGEIETIVIGDGTSQRSRVDGLTITFDSEVTLQEGAFEVAKRGADGGAVDVAVTSNVVGGKTVVDLAFSGAFTEAGSLVDGNYQLRVVSSKITDVLGNEFDGDEDGVVGGDRLLGTDAADNFFRFYGDSTGDRVVGFGDFIAFRGAFGSSSGDGNFNKAFDFNDDDAVGFQDFIAFRSRFGQSLDFE